MTTLKSYRVGVCEELGGYITVEAESESAAEDRALEMVDDRGLAELQNEGLAEITSRNTFNC